MDYSCHHSNSNRSELLKRIQEYEFAAVELNLYLDNNPNNQKLFMTIIASVRIC